MNDNLPAALARLPVVLAVAARRAFSPAAAVPFGVDFDDGDSMDRYREAQAWCADNCRARWSVAPERQLRRAEFSFEGGVEAVHFALCWAGVAWR
jgi:hypothetical protein